MKMEHPSNSVGTRVNWFSRAWHFLTTPHPSVHELGERRRAQLLSALSLILVSSLLWAISIRPATTTFYILLGITLLTYIFSRTKYYLAGIYLFSFGYSSLAYITIYLGTASSIESAVFPFVPLTLVVASALLSRRGFLLLAVFIVIATFSAPSYSSSPTIPTDSIGRTGGVIFSICAVFLGINIFRESLERARLKELQDANLELADIRTNLEQRVEERASELEAANQQTSRRAAQLQTITEFSEAIAQLQDLNDILPAAARLISESFGFYHVGIFLLDQPREYAVLQAANSEGGARMLARSHRLRLGSGVVGFVAQRGQPRIALNVETDSVYSDNPDLPDTLSEAALPLKSRGEIIGVLDVQSTESNAFSNEDLRVLIALANQVAIALENARLLTETRAALKHVQDVYSEYTRTAWSRTVTKAEYTGFRYQSGRIEIIEQTLNSPEVISAAATGEVVDNQGRESGRERNVVAVPVKLRGEVIGVLQIESNDSSRIWQADEVGLVEAVAERAAFALENARLFQNARRRAAKERLISEATAKIGGAFNIENILQTTAEELERALGGTEVLIQFNRNQ